MMKSKETTTSNVARPIVHLSFMGCSVNASPVNGISVEA